MAEPAPRTTVVVGNIAVYRPLGDVKFAFQSFGEIREIYWMNRMTVGIRFSDEIAADSAIGMNGYHYGLTNGKDPLYIRSLEREREEAIHGYR